MLQTFVIDVGKFLHISSLQKILETPFGEQEVSIKLRPNDGAVDITASDWSGVALTDVQTAVDSSPTVDESIRIKDVHYLTNDCKLQALVHWIAATHDMTVEQLNSELVDIIDGL
jgi:hypothetical protein